MNYLRAWFIVDVVACAPVDLAMRAVEGQLACSFAVNGCTESRSVSNSNALKLFKLLRIFRLLKLLRLFTSLDWCSGIKTPHLLSLLHLHRARQLAGDPHLALGRLPLRHDARLGRRHVQVEAVVARRVLAVQSITSVGYGDIPAENSYSQTLSIFTMLIGVVLVSWIMTNVLSAMNPDSSARRFRAFAVCARVPQNNQLPSGWQSA